MNFLFIIIYLYILTYPFRKKTDLFSPTSVWSILVIFYSVPFLCIAFTTRELSSPFVLGNCGQDYDYYLHIFMVNQSIFAICYYLAFSIFSRAKTKKKRGNSIIWSIPVSKKICGIMFPLMYFIGFSMIAYFIISFGGLLVLISTFSEDKSSISDGSQIFLSFSSFFVYLGAIFHIKYLSYCKRRLLGLIICLFFGFSILSVAGGRGPFLTYVITVGICYTYFINKFSLLSMKLMPLYIGLAVFFVVMLGLRMSNDSDMGEMLADNSLSLLGGSSYVDIQAGLEEYFHDHDFWMGKTFENPHHAFIPRSLLPSKRPVDEGVYVFAAIYDGVNVFNKDSYINSWPPSTLGSMYSNFGYFGIVFGAFLLAFIHHYFYKLFKNNTNNILVVYLYSFAIIKFQLTFYYFANMSYHILYLLAFVIIFKLFYLFRPSRFNFSKNYGQTLDIVR